MNNKLIALAVAAAISAPAAVATAAPSVGGHIQIEIAQPDVKDSTTNASDQLKMTDNKRGRFWIKGNEDLGGGLKSVYKFEFQVDTSQDYIPPASGASSGVGLSGQRVTMVGVKGAFGEVTFGRRNSPYKLNAGVDFDPYNATELESRGNGGALKNEGSMTASFGINSFQSDSVTYKKGFGAVKVHAMYMLKKSNTYTTDNTYALALRFKAGAGIEVIAATIKEPDNTATAKNGGTRSKIGASWKGGPHKVVARYESQNDNLADNDVTAVFAGYHLTMGKNILTLQYGTVDGKAKADDQTYTMIAVKHKLSKKTSTWLGYKSADFKESTGTDHTDIVLGLRVNF